MPDPPGASAGAWGDGVKQGKEVPLTFFWEGEDLFDGANRPDEDDLLRAPDGVAFAELLEVDWLLPCSVFLSINLEEFVDGQKKVSYHLLSFVWLSLEYTDEVIEVYFDVG